MKEYDVAVIGAGIVGISVAYYLVGNHGFKNVILIDPRDPMSLTSAQSGENYRNWWPHQLMTAFTDHSIDLMEAIALRSDNRINLTRRGYTLVTRRSTPDDLMDDLKRGYGDAESDTIRIHSKGSSNSYAPPISAEWQRAPDGVDVITDQALIQKTFPSFATDIATVIHIRRAGSLSGQQLGQFMLETIRPKGGVVLKAAVTAIETGSPFTVHTDGAQGKLDIRARFVVNAAGPFFTDVAKMLGEKLHVKCVFQQKISFEDREGAIPRDMPFSIDLDGQELDWTEEERSILSEDPEMAPYLASMPGSIHCRPDGAENGKWIKVGWAFNDTATDPHSTDPINPHFPDIVLRGASRLNPKLRAYIGRLPRGAHHYGGYYAMTEENLPLIGPMETAGAFMAGALSGFGTMSACSTGELCAAWIAGSDVPGYARSLGLERFSDNALMGQLKSLSERSVL